jgi:hypothetical protein
VSKSSRRLGLFGSTRGQTVTVIETNVARNQRRKATIGFWVTAVIVGLLSALVAAEQMHPILGGLLGIVCGALTGAVVFVLVIVWPVLRVLWHWLPEIALGCALVLGWTWLLDSTPLWGSLLVVALVLGVPAGIGPVRRWVVAWSWCLIVRHRLRVCFAAFLATNRHGTLPLILPARPTPAGERVWVWLRPGLSLRDLEQDGQVQKLAVACWANEVRVTRASRNRAALIRIDITRREPLADTIASSLPDHVPAGFPANAPTSPGMPPVGLDLPDVSDTPVPVEGPRPRRPRTTPPPPDPIGFDPADYA